MFSVNVTVKAVGLSDYINGRIEKIQAELAYRIVDEAQQLIDDSIPTGRLYRRGSFNRRHSRGFGQRASGPGRRFHRASAPGQPPAKDTGKTYQSITVRRMAKGKYRVRFGGAAGYLEFGTSRMRARPFIIPAIEKAVRKTLG